MLAVGLRAHDSLQSQCRPAHIQIEILGDTVDEPPLLYGEWGLVQLSNPTNAAIDTGGLFGLGLFVIVDDD